MPNIIIYTHMQEFNFNDGGTVVQYLLAKILDELGQIVRIYSSSGIKTENSIFSKYYNNEFPIDENTVVIYCEGTLGNPLNAPKVVRWLLSKLGQNVPYSCLDTWGKNELVYYFNSEEKISKNPEKLGNIFKLLNVIYIHPYATKYNLNPRKGTCFTFRKAIQTHGKMPKIVHPANSFEITKKHTQIDYIKIFNNHKYFISYDSITFLSVLAALCGCISIVIKKDGLSKEEWLNTFPTIEYLKNSQEKTLYGIAYGSEDMEHAINTLHLVKTQWENIYNFSKEKYVKSFIEDINNFDNMTNTIEKNFFFENNKIMTIYGVYFICCINNYLEVVDEQLSILQKGLIDITKKLIIFVTKYNINDDKLNNIFSKYNTKNNFIFITTPDNVYEKFAINNYKNFIEDKEYYIYYFHTKAVKPDDDPLKHILSSRRKILNFYTLEKYFINIKLLELYDTVGCSLHLYPKKHYSGNFWWSKSNYTNNLSNINDNYLSPEMYILSNDNCKYISLANDTNDILFENYIFRDDYDILKDVSIEFKNNIEHKDLITKC